MPYIGKQLGFTNLAGDELFLDADSDTSITASTDDQIDIKIGGADDFAFKANSFEVQGSSNIDMNGTELILDADGDTSITADTDDQIDIKISGADDFQFTANTFTAQSGSTIAAQALTATPLSVTGDINFNGGNYVFNDDSADKDFRVESDNDANAFFVQGSDGKIGMGISTPRNNLDFGVTSNNDHIIALRDNNTSRTILGLSNGYGVRVASPSDGTATESMFEVGEIAASDGTTYQNTHLKLTYNGDLGVGVGVTPNTFSGYQAITVGGSVATTGSGIDFEDSSGNIDGRAFGEYGGLQLVADPGNATAGSSIRFDVDGTERVRIDSGGNLIANSGDSVATVIYDDSSGDAGPILHAEHRVDITRNSSMIALNSTTSSSASFVDLRRVGSTIGTIGHDSASTVSYNAFTGCHWGRLSDNSKPTILKGTILETIDEMCDWYEVEFTIPEIKYVDGDEVPEGKKVGDVKTKSKNKRYLVPLEDIGSKKLGDSFTFTYKDNVKYTGTLKLEDDEKHSKCKVSDTADSKKVYGVFFSWDGEDDGYNDMYVAGLGTYVVRVNKDVTVESGDLLVSNGDGTAKVQDDDIIRSKTVAKVLANVKQETYSDGSYTVPCALYCG